MTRIQMIIIGAAVLVGGALLLVFLGILPGLQTETAQSVQSSITIWGVGKDDGQFQDAITAFNAQFPKVSVSYRGFYTFESYDKALIEAFATNKAPNVFMISNESFPRYANKIKPLAKYSPAELQVAYPDTASQTFVRNGQVYAIPLTIDTLALLYNKSLYANAGIAVPPTTWEEIRAMTSKFTKRDTTGAILSSAIPLGASEANAKYATDVLTTMMIQSGVQMTTPGGTNAIFANDKSKAVLDFYSQFSNAKSENYTWNGTLQQASDLFAQEKVAMVFGYLSDVRELRNKNPFLNFGVARFPQFEHASPANSATHPKYYALASSAQNDATHDSLAKTFMLFFTNNDIAASYAKVVNEPSALLALNDSYTNDASVQVFAKQILIAKSWAKPDENATRSILSTAIEGLNSGKLTLFEVLPQAESRVNALNNQ